MAYDQLWGELSPGHFTFLIDLSGSMENKIDYTIDVLMATFKELIRFCIKGDQIKSRLYCTVIGYNSKAEIIWNNMSINEIVKKLIVFKRCGTPIFNKEIEFKPQGQTYMRLAFDEAKKDIEKWIEKLDEAKMKKPAPVVINITDGCPYEGEDKTWDEVSQETLKSALALMSISTPDGNVRLFNILYEPEAKNSTSIFPSQCPSHPAEKFLYEASSIMDERTLEIIRNYNSKITTNARCMASNVKDLNYIIRLICLSTVYRF